MPNYNYTCKKCQNKLELNRTVNDRDNMPHCPRCEILMDRDFNVPYISFKGEGWTPKKENTPAWIKKANKSPEHIREIVSEVEYLKSQKHKANNDIRN